MNGNGISILEWGAAILASVVVVFVIYLIRDRYFEPRRKLRELLSQIDFMLNYYEDIIMNPGKVDDNEGDYDDHADDCDGAPDNRGNLVDDKDGEPDSYGIHEDDYDRDSDVYDNHSDDFQEHPDDNDGNAVEYEETDDDNENTVEYDEQPDDYDMNEAREVLRKAADAFISHIEDNPGIKFKTITHNELESIGPKLIRLSERIGIKEYAESNIQEVKDLKELLYAANEKDRE